MRYKLIGYLRFGWRNVSRAQLKRYYFLLRRGRCLAFIIFDPQRFTLSDQIHLSVDSPEKSHSLARNGHRGWSTPLKNSLGMSQA